MIRNIGIIVFGISTIVFIVLFLRGFRGRRKEGTINTISWLSMPVFFGITLFAFQYPFQPGWGNQTGLKLVMLFAVVASGLVMATSNYIDNRRMVHRLKREVSHGNRGTIR